MEEKISASDAYLEKVNYHALAEWMAAEVSAARRAALSLEARGPVGPIAARSCRPDSISYVVARDRS